MKTTLLVEGKTEKAFMPPLQAFLKNRLENTMPRLDVLPYDGRIPTNGKLKRQVERLLNNRRRTPSDHVVALTDVYTGKPPPIFQNATDARNIYSGTVIP